MVPPKISLLKLTQGKTIKDMYEKHQIIQDMFVPISTLSSALLFFHKELQVNLVYIYVELYGSDIQVINLLLITSEPAVN